MHRIEWTSNGEVFAIVTDGTAEDAIGLALAVRANVAGGRDEETRRLLSQTADALGRLAEHLVPDGNQSSK